MRASSDNGIDEHDFRMLYPNDDESDGQSPWLTRQDLYPMVALAGLYVVLQTVVSHPNSFTTALVAHGHTERLLDLLCRCKNHPYHQTLVDILHGRADEADSGRTYPF